MINTPLDRRIAHILRQINELYGTHFEQNLYSLYVDQFPLNASDYHDIRYVLKLIEPMYKDIPYINRGLASLELYINCFKEIVVPDLTKNHQSARYHRTPGSLKDEMRLKLKMAAYVLPLNIKRMTDLINELKEALPPMTSYYRRIRQRHNKKSKLY